MRKGRAASVRPREGAPFKSDRLGPRRHDHNITGKGRQAFSLARHCRVASVIQEAEFSAEESQWHKRHQAIGKRCRGRGSNTRWLAGRSRSLHCLPTLIADLQALFGKLLYLLDCKDWNGKMTCYVLIQRWSWLAALVPPPVAPPA